MHSLRPLRRPGGALVDLRLFTYRAFTTSVTVTFCSSVAMFGALILVPLHEQVVCAGDTLDAGLLIPLLLYDRIDDATGWPQLTTAIVVMGLGHGMVAPVWWPALLIPRPTTGR